MTRKKKESLERLADLLLLDQALADGAVSSTRNRHGFGKWMRERGMISASMQSEIDSKEKTGWSPEQLDSIITSGLDRQTRRRYQKED